MPPRNPQSIRSRVRKSAKLPFRIAGIACIRGALCRALHRGHIRNCRSKQMHRGPSASRATGVHPPGRPVRDRRRGDARQPARPLRRRGAGRCRRCSWMSLAAPHHRCGPGAARARSSPSTRRPRCWPGPARAAPPPCRSPMPASMQQSRGCRSTTSRSRKGRWPRWRGCRSQAARWCSPTCRARRAPRNPRCATRSKCCAAHRMSPCCRDRSWRT